MGTLFEQPLRKELRVDLEGSLQEMARIARKYNCGLSDLIALKSALELERANNLSVANGDIMDENMAGLGLLLRDLTGAIENLPSKD